MQIDSKPRILVTGAAGYGVSRLSAGRYAWFYVRDTGTAPAATWAMVCGG